MKTALLILALALPLSTMAAQSPPLPDPGINFGNMLEAPKEGAWGVSLKERYFETVAKAGFKTVRLPIRWSSRALEKPPYTIDPVFFARVDKAVEAARKQNLTLILDLHHYEELFDKPDVHTPRFLSLWKQIAEHYRNEPPSVVFELCNEPHKNLDSVRWNILLAGTLAVIRPSNPDRTVIVGPAEWNSMWKLPELVLPENDDRLVVTVHYYDPMHFTHQNASWVPGSEAWAGTPWTGTEQDRAPVDATFDKLLAWSQANKRPVFVGEFGAFEKAPLPDRARWTDYVARSLATRKISSAYWEFCSGFGLYDPKAEKWQEPLLKAVLLSEPPTPPAPAAVEAAPSSAPAATTAEPAPAPVSPNPAR